MKAPSRNVNRGGRVDETTAFHSTQFQTSIGHCSRCGKNKHPKEQCPTRKVMCNKCQITQHYARQCRNPEALNQVSSTETAFLGNIDCENIQWCTVAVRVDKVPIIFKDDTGADVKVIPAAT